MFYLDSSVIVALLTAEPESSRADAWLAGQANDALAGSDWMMVEVSAALAAKLRAGAVNALVRRQAMKELSSMRNHSAGSE